MRRTLLLIGASAMVATGAVVLYGKLQERPGPDQHAAPSRATGGIIETAQRTLRTNPKDAATWAKLGSAYVEEARLTGDPLLYGKAEGALSTSLELQPDGNPAALVSRGALAVARHEFAEGRDWALKAQRASGEYGPLYGVLTDACLNLGDYPAAKRALQRMLDLSPGVAAFLRAAHYFQLTGQPGRADEVLGLASDAAVLPADVALVWARRGELAWWRGSYSAALTAYDRALAVAPAYPPALAGRARVKAALGRSAEAIADYDAAIARGPHPGLLAELGELHQRLGDRAAAERQFALVRATWRLQPRDDFAMGQFAADHGDPARAVRHLRAEWERRESVEVADALGWALHRAGRQREALAYARKAMALGGGEALFAYHRGAIELTLGQERAGRRSLQSALGGGLTQAAEARRLLE